MISIYGVSGTTDDVVSPGPEMKVDITNKIIQSLYFFLVTTPLKYSPLYYSKPGLCYSAEHKICYFGKQMGSSVVLDPSDFRKNLQNILFCVSQKKYTIPFNMYKEIVHCVCILDVGLTAENCSRKLLFIAVHT